MKKRIENIIHDSIAAHVILENNEREDRNEEKRVEFYLLIDNIKKEAEEILLGKE